MTESEKGKDQNVLMERAGEGIAHFILDFVSHSKMEKRVFLFAGKGNNAGDGYTACRKLLEHGFAISIFECLSPSQNSLCAKKKEELLKKGRDQVSFVSSIDKEGIILDALFGIGFQGEADEELLEKMDYINTCPLPIFSIDIPSGIDANTGKRGKVAVCANITLACEWPKLGCFLEKGFHHAGSIISIPIGLETHYKDFCLVEPAKITPLLPPISRSRHKYEAGHVVGLGGSMPGASILASYAALRSGAGIVHLAHHKDDTASFQGPPWEIVRVSYDKKSSKAIRKLIQKAGCCFVGSGAGSRREDLDLFWDDYKDKAIIDADAISWIAEKKEDLGHLPGTIFTPHFGELKKLLDLPEDATCTKEVLYTAREFTCRHNTHMVVKGGPSFIISQDKPILIIAEGSPGMATAGSGDALTGILASLYAQGLPPEYALLLGTTLHGMAGSIAAQKETPYAMTASSIIQALGESFKQMGHSSRI